MSRQLYASLFFLMICFSPVWLLANTDPYRVVICLRMSENPRLTRRFEQAVGGEVQDQLANYFGNLADIELHTGDHWLLDALGDRSLDELAVAAELLSGRKTRDRFFLVTVDHEVGEYRIDFRQLDGELRAMGPVHTRRTPDRQWVGKAICLAVKDSFAPVATIGPHPADQKKVELTFRGPPAEIPRAVSGSCLLAPFRLVRQRDGGSVCIPVANTVLLMSSEQAKLLEDGDGISTASVESNLANPWYRPSSVMGFLAVKIRTQNGRVRLRIVDQETKVPAVNCLVYANDQGFEFRDEHVQGQPNARGWLLSKDTFRDVAFVKIVQGDSEILLPIPITDNVCTRQLEMPVDKKAGEKSKLGRELRYLVQDLQTLNVVMNDRFAEVNRANTGKRYEAALEIVRETSRLITSQVETAQRNASSLQKLAEELNVGEHPLLNVATQQLKKLQQRGGAIGDLENSLKGTIEKQNAKSRADAMIKLAADAEQSGDIDEAMLRYHAALTELPDDANLRQKITRLEETWRIKNPAHQRARDTIYELWANAEITEVAPNLANVKQAFETMKSVGDHLSLLKLLSVNGSHLSDLSSLVEQLAGRATEADQAEYERYAGLVREVADFQQEVSGYLQNLPADVDGRDTVSDRPATVVEPAPAGPRPPAVSPPKSLLDEEEEEEEEPIG